MTFTDEDFVAGMTAIPAGFVVFGECSFIMRCKKNVSGYTDDGEIPASTRADMPG